MENYKGWNVQLETLQRSELMQSSFSAFFETNDHKYGIYFYDIGEFRMGAEVGHIALYNYKNSETPFFNPSTSVFWFENQHSPFAYSPVSNTIILRLLSFNTKLNQTEFPFILIKPEQKIATIIPWDFSSIYYNIVERGKDSLVLKETRPDLIKRFAKENRNNEIFDLRKMMWFPLSNFEHELKNL